MVILTNRRRANETRSFKGSLEKDGERLATLPLNQSYIICHHLLHPCEAEFFVLTASHFSLDTIPTVRKRTASARKHPFQHLSREWFSREWLLWYLHPGTGARHRSSGTGRDTESLHRQRPPQPGQSTHEPSWPPNQHKGRSPSCPSARKTRSCKHWRLESLDRSIHRSFQRGIRICTQEP